MEDFYEIRHIGALAMRESFDLALKFDLDLEEIIMENYLNGQEKIGKKVDFSEKTPINIFNIYSRKYASSAIWEYELFKNEKIYFYFSLGKIFVKRKIPSSEHLKKAKLFKNISERLAERQIAYLKSLFKN